MAWRDWRPANSFKLAATVDQVGYFLYAVIPEHLKDFASPAKIEFLLADENTSVDGFKDKLRWNDLYYHLSKGL